MNKKTAMDPNINNYFRSLTLEGQKWMYYTKKAQLSKIKDVFDRDIKPHLSKDCDSIKLMDIQNNIELKIKYHRVCDKSISSINRTLSFIQDVLRRKVFPDIKVVPV